jgi:hypothetical protein
VTTICVAGGEGRANGRAFVAENVADRCLASARSSSAARAACSGK